MGVWVLIYVKFWGEQCGLVKVCKKDFIFKTSGARIWSKVGSPIRRSSRGDRSGTAHHGGLGFGPNLDHPSDDPHVEIGPAPPIMGGSDPKNSKIEQ